MENKKYEFEVVVIPSFIKVPVTKDEDKGGFTDPYISGQKFLSKLLNDGWKIDRSDSVVCDSNGELVYILSKEIPQ